MSLQELIWRILELLGRTKAVVSNFKVTRVNQIKLEG